MLLAIFSLQPVEVSQHWLLFDSICDRANLKQFGPLHHPDVNELFALQQFIDQLFAFERIGIGHELIVIFINRRQSSGDVDETHDA